MSMSLDRPTAKALTQAELGAAGEELVWHHYERRGFELLDRNWRAGRAGELDLVMIYEVGKTSLVVFCEVKTRRSLTHELGLAAVDARKRNRLRALAGRWMLEHEVRATDIRGDVASVVWRQGLGQVDIIEGAF